MARELAHPDITSVSLDTVLAALADPIRREIITQLSTGHNDQACIAFELPVSKSTSTHHFRVLREAGLITQRYEGTAILNTLRCADMESRFPGLLGAVIKAECRTRGRAASVPADAVHGQQ
ncbi:helix-turn-helix transcriptional regulator [Arthrobacter sp. Sa2CUA1]|uniref:Helix-turn-helix transcriptional regulator n=1 Tax=Arthrobacter gallicola TaxID=2762225 RepID=A0ABR8UPV8_9MICC|nr:ArsR family transcriptional regulator [Arthrobacter gallicola]MBD7994594.1 helix-turn-helix transcriptional regulator [Arthrobacter gallicola]